MRRPYFSLLLLVPCLLNTATLLGAVPPPLERSCSVSFPDALKSGNYTFRIPMTWVGRLPAVKAKVDTMTGIFLFDTGAERLLLNNRFFSGDVQLTGMKQYGVTGGNNDVFSKKVDTLKWENLYLPNLTANVLSLSHIEKARNISIVGIIGYEVFKDYEVLLDYGAQLIVLTKLDKNGYRYDPNAFLEAPVDSLDFELARHGVVLRGEVNNKTLKLHLDSGAEINLLDRLVSAKVLKQFTILKRVNLLGAGENKVEVLAGTLAGVLVDQQPCDTMRTLLTNLDDLSLILGTRVDGVLGFEYLRPRRIVINYTRKKLFFLKPL
jgi:hypothetical protein